MRAKSKKRPTVRKLVRKIVKKGKSRITHAALQLRPTLARFNRLAKRPLKIKAASWGRGQRPVIYLHGPSGTGKATLIRWLAARLGSFQPVVAHIEGAACITCWPEAKLIAIGDYASVTPPGADAYTLTQCVKAIEHVRKHNGDTFQIICEGKPFTDATFVSRAARDDKHYYVTAKDSQRERRMVRKHRYEPTGEPKPAVMRAVAETLPFRSRLDTSTPASCEVALHLLAGAMGRALDPAGYCEPAAVTEYAEYKRHSEAGKVTKANRGHSQAGKASARANRAGRRKKSPRRRLHR